MPTLVEVVAFVANRDGLTEKFCVNIEAPTLDCRAACYLSDQVAQIGIELSEDTSGQFSDNTTPSNGPTYVLPKVLELNAPLLAAIPRSKPAVPQLNWTARYIDVASPPPLG